MYKHFLNQGSKWTITTRPVSIDSTFVVIPSYIELPWSRMNEKFHIWYWCIELWIYDRHINLLISTEAAVPRCSSKKRFLKLGEHSQENTCAGVPFKKRCRPEDLLKRDSITVVFLWIPKFLKTTFFIEHLWWLILVQPPQYA